jgi:hypothetical protein
MSKGPPPGRWRSLVAVTTEDDDDGTYEWLKRLPPLSSIDIAAARSIPLEDTSISDGAPACDVGMYQP